MRIVLIIVVIIGVLGGVVWWQLTSMPLTSESPRVVAPSSESASPVADGVIGDVASAPAPTPVPAVSVVAEQLNIPWEVLFLPDGRLLVTELPGRVTVLGESVQSFAIDGVEHVGDGGLLGAALHPAFADNQFLYLYQTTAAENSLTNRIVRYRFTGDALVLDRVIAADLPGARFHDGGRLAFGPDGMLYATVGDALDPAAAQDTSNLKGTIIRLTPEGEIPTDNPFPGSVIWSYGHRNAQGLAWDNRGRLWSTEHGRSVTASGYDELNLIVPGGNYGWPDSEGETVASGTIAPVRHSGATNTWAPASAAYFDGSIYFAGLRGETLYEAVLDEQDGVVVDWHEHLVREYGRLRTVTVGPDGLLYLTTSNRDGRGDAPITADDRILRIDPAQLTR